MTALTGSKIISKVTSSGGVGTFCSVGMGIVSGKKVPPVIATLSVGVTGFFASSHAPIAGDGLVSAEIAASKSSRSSARPLPLVFGPSPQSWITSLHSAGRPEQEMPKRSMISEIVEKTSFNGAAMPSKILSSGPTIASIASFKKFSIPLISPLTRVSIPQRASDQKSSRAPKIKSSMKLCSLVARSSILQPIFARVSSKNF